MKKKKSIARNSFKATIVVFLFPVVEEVLAIQGDSARIRLVGSHVGDQAKHCTIRSTGTGGMTEAAKRWMFPPCDGGLGVARR
jgi:hypothetical protein